MFVQQPAVWSHPVLLPLRRFPALLPLYISCKEGFDLDIPSSKSFHSVGRPAVGLSVSLLQDASLS